MAADPETVKELGGAAAWFIGMMATAIAGLATAVGLQWKHGNKVYGFRLAERDELNKALTGSAKAQEAATRAQEEQNRVIEELADAMRAMASSHERLIERLAMQSDHGKDRERDLFSKMEDIVRAVASMAEANRNTGAIASDIRNHLSKQGII